MGRALLLVTLAVVALAANPFAPPSAAEGEVRATSAASKKTLRLGVTTLALARNAYEPWKLSDLVEVGEFARAADGRVRVVSWFADWENGSFDPEQARAVRAMGAVPNITWEPWDSRSGALANQPRYRLRRIIEGDHDTTIRRWARAIAAYGHPVRLRLGHEMNGRWYPWGEYGNGNRKGEFVRMWRHVRRIFKREGATNVRWVWSPVAGHIPRSMFPGRSEVNIVGLSGYNGGTVAFRKRWVTFVSAFGPSLERLEELAPGRPIEISEIGSAEEGGSKSRWIYRMFRYLRRHPEVRTLIWFDVEKEADWRITSSPGATEAFRRGYARLVREARR